jgi:hypothetical protein
MCNSDHFFTKCSTCQNLCSHRYVCSCPDNQPLYKHIHKVHSMIVRQEPYPMLETFSEAEDIQLSSIPVSLPTQRAPSINNIYKHLDIDVYY